MPTLYRRNGKLFGFADIPGYYAIMSWESKVESIIKSRHSNWALGVASFLEAIIIPIPLETILIPMMQIDRKRMWWLATVALIGCVLASGVGYLLGWWVMDTIGNWLINNWWSTAQYNEAKSNLESGGFWFVLSVGVTPIPFQIAMLAAGAIRYSIPLFILATFVARGIRYYGLAVLVYFLGDHAEEFYRKNKLLFFILVTVLVVGLWVLLYSLR